ncbi:MAG TPA: hypothetical protein VGA99_03510, partial [bacterium]
MSSRKAQRRRALHNQITRLNQRLSRLGAQSNRFSYYRLLTFFSGMAVGISGYYLLSAALGWGVIACTLVIFNFVAFFHRRVLRRIRRHQIWLELKSSQVARMDLDWDRIPITSATTPDPEHPFELDLDITGKKSLQQLIDVAVSYEGSARLRHWLLATEPDLDEIKLRQETIRELTPLARFRHKLWLAIRLVTKDTLDGNKLLNALTSSTTSSSLRWLLPLSAGLAVINMLLLALNQLAWIPAWWILSLVVYGL